MVPSWLRSAKVPRLEGATLVNACPKCAGEMEAGTSSARNAGRHVWFRGDTYPELNLHLFPPGAELSTPLHPVVTYRCTRCGFLESYAAEAQ